MAAKTPVPQAKRSPRSKLRPAAATAKPAKPTKPTKPADAIGSLHAESASLWFLAIDAQAAAGWTGDEGHDYDEDPAQHDDDDDDDDPSDFARALKVQRRKHPVLAVGKEHGVIVSVGGCGWSWIWGLPDGIALLEYYPSHEVDERSAATRRQLAAVVHLPAKGKPASLGRVHVRCGVLALLLPAEPGTFTPAEIRKAARASKARSAGGGSRVLVPLRGQLRVLRGAGRLRR